MPAHALPWLSCQYTLLSRARLDPVLQARMASGRGGRGPSGEAPVQQVLVDRSLGLTPRTEVWWVTWARGGLFGGWVPPVVAMPRQPSAWAACAGREQKWP